ncbi:MAG TPA: hypothetical protein VGW38_29560 [Chloroflexota bacterium]|nr:hypothetical protein [Chloroflexota bacterium]
MNETERPQLTSYEQETLELWREGVERLVQTNPVVFSAEHHIGYYHVFPSSRANIPRELALRRLAAKGYLEAQGVYAFCYRERKERP